MSGKKVHKKTNLLPFTPIFISISVIIGILLGSFFANHFASNKLNIVNTTNNKLGDLLHIIEDQYVDTINITELVDNSLSKILKDLDPHSAYIPSKDVEISTQELKGKFFGIGIQFRVIQDTINIIHVVEGGPSDGIGLEMGDKIVQVDGKSFVGKELDTEQILSTLKGAEGSVVKLGIKRNKVKGLQTYTIVRGAVPIKSIDVAYMITPTTGYIKINSFSEQTHAELLASLAKLNSEGMQSLILDLRDNSGGYLQTAVRVANEFLPVNRLITYIKGNKFPQEEYKSDGRGTYPTLPLVVLINEFSASASEILAGAIQDNDRGTIIGRRSFGKGLVQQPIEFNDGSLIRLTIARYYTPSGRCVQRPYKHGDEKTYEQDFINRLTSGESFSMDSIKTAGEVYKTSIGRPVYGGGGIIPDYFIAQDTTNQTSYFIEAIGLKGDLIRDFAYYYALEHKSHFEEMDLDNLIKTLQRAKLPEQFAIYANERGLSKRNLMLRKSYNLFERILIRLIIDFVKGTADASVYYNKNDKAIEKALEFIQTENTVPKITTTKLLNN